MVLLWQKAEKSDTTMRISFIKSHFLKASMPIADRLLLTVKEAKLLQPSKVRLPIDITLQGMVNEIKPVQSEYL